MPVYIPLDENRIAGFCQRWKIAEFAFFGSVLRDDFRPDSDVDVLVTFRPDSHWSLFDLVQMQEELEEVLGRKVDLIEQKRQHKGGTQMPQISADQRKSASPFYV